MRVEAGQEARKGRGSLDQEAQHLVGPGIGEGRMREEIEDGEGEMKEVASHVDLRSACRCNLRTEPGSQMRPEGSYLSLVT